MGLKAGPATVRSSHVMDVVTSYRLLAHYSKMGLRSLRATKEQGLYEARSSYQVQKGIEAFTSAKISFSAARYIGANHCQSIDARCRRNGYVPPYSEGYLRGNI